MNITLQFSEEQQCLHNNYSINTEESNGYKTIGIYPDDVNFEISKMVNSARREAFISYKEVKKIADDYCKLFNKN